MRKIDVTQYTVETDKLKDDYTFVMLSDLHSNEYGINLHKVNRIIKENAPDAVLVAGDMINDKYSDDPTQVASFLGTLAGHYPVFYGLGNHEYDMWKQGEEMEDKYLTYRSYLAEQGVVFLEDETVVLEKSESAISLSGLMIDMVFYNKIHRKTMGHSLVDKHLGTCNTEVFNLLIAHNPDYFHRYAEWGADLVLSGHVHGGIVRLPLLGGVASTNLKLFPKYDSGLFSHKESKMILGRGLGAHTIKLRICNHPEVVIVKVLAKR